MNRFRSYSILLPYLVIYLTTIFFASCEDTHQQTSLSEPSVSGLLEKSVPKERFENSQKKIGEMHNEALEAVYQAIKKNSLKIRCIDDLINTAQKGMNEYWWNKKISCDDQAIKRAFEKHNYKSYLIPKEKFLKNLSDRGLNKKQLVFIDSYYNLIDKRMPLNDLKITIERFNEGAVKELSETEVKHVLAASSLVESSYEYHIKKNSEWIELVKSLPIERNNEITLAKTTEPEIDVNAVIVADISAFATALLSCAESLLFTVYPACVAVYTSMASAIVLLYQCITILVQLLF